MKKTSWKKLFWKRIAVQGSHWIWNGHVTKHGVPYFSHVDDEYRGAATKISVLYKTGRKAPSLLRPTCGYQYCVNPAHLEEKNAARDGDIRYLRKSGCSLRQLGDKYYLSAERVRQICE